MYTVLTIMDGTNCMRPGIKFLIVPTLPALPVFAAAQETIHHYDRIHQGASAQTRIENDTVIIKKAAHGGLFFVALVTPVTGSIR